MGLMVSPGARFRAAGALWSPAVRFLSPMRMRQSIAEIEDAFFEEIEEDRERRERLRRRARAARSRERQAERTHRHGSMRFFLLVLVLIATAVVVTIAMFQTLYYVLG